MRKQIDFDVRVFALGNGANGSMTREQVSEFIRENYMGKGWEVFSDHINQVSGGSIYYQVVFIKYEDVAETPAVKVSAK
jgi:hypothetical protein